ncbi:uncharacterized protein CELE_C10A4.13 [Caenorhabditis elegans]|uniref:Uncharacterized protein n=1 Tax=Caenorhabditis elegans TaxID=6239 RepID=G1K0U5_CAEEL|nr:Uncharacterized protein CELE_C10A4.13 [Caenorhabditis elegans]CCD62393.1 Uncharacterized protein CELE_C10A4.13 [Caenorhabditis elegans]|eukprot:NP_001257047.1 Uncharacterized protein CELE_C10A4.13 [Caenorhabditis elegans]
MQTLEFTIVRGDYYTLLLINQISTIAHYYPVLQTPCF